LIFPLKLTIFRYEGAVPLDQNGNIIRGTSKTFIDDEEQPPLKKVCNPVLTETSEKGYPEDLLMPYGASKFLFRVIEFKCVDFKFCIQDIQIVDEYTIKDVIDDFDMGFCQSTFDGKRMCIYNPEDIIKRKSDVVFGKKFFEFVFNMSGFSVVNCLKVLKRIQKYRKRGYEVNVVEECTPVELLDVIKNNLSQVDRYSAGYIYGYFSLRQNKQLMPWYRFIREARDTNFNVDTDVGTLTNILGIEQYSLYSVDEDVGYKEGITTNEMLE
jgi:hypothetical protein